MNVIKGVLKTRGGVDRNQQVNRYTYEPKRGHTVQNQIFRKSKLV